MQLKKNQEKLKIVKKRRNLIKQKEVISLTFINLHFNFEHLFKSNVNKIKLTLVST